MFGGLTSPPLGTKNERLEVIESLLHEGLIYRVMTSALIQRLCCYGLLSAVHHTYSAMFLQPFRTSFLFSLSIYIIIDFFEKIKFSLSNYRKNILSHVRPFSCTLSAMRGLIYPVLKQVLFPQITK